MVRQDYRAGHVISVKGSLPTGALAWVTCQRVGSKVGTTSVWDKLTNGRWVSASQGEGHRYPAFQPVPASAS
jgi:hypothetical protein